MCVYVCGTQRLTAWLARLAARALRALGVSPSLSSSSEDAARAGLRPGRALRDVVPLADAACVHHTSTETHVE